MPLPQARGPLSAELIAVLTGDDPAARGLGPAARQALRSADVLTDDDVQLYLALSYEMHHRGIAGVSDSWEWNPALLLVRSLVERVFEAALRGAADVDRPMPAGPDAVMRELRAMTGSATKRSLAAYLAGSATVEQLRELVVVRSGYHLKEADALAFAVPRVSGAPKAAMVRMAAGQGGLAHPATVFGDAMRALDLDHRYGVMVDRVPAVALAAVNAMSLFAVHRRLCGAIVGHLAASEIAGAGSDSGLVPGLRRLGFAELATRFADPQVPADPVFAPSAGGSLAASVAEAQPGLVGDLLFGARARLALQDMVARHLMDGWRRGGSALR